MSIEAVLFDLDGTLVHSEGVAARALMEVCEQRGVRIDPSLAAEVTGKTWNAAFQIIGARVRLPLPHDELLALVMAEYRAKLALQIDAVPGSVQAVQSLAAHYRLALVSGSYREEIHFALDQLGIRSHFSPILGAEDYPASKPAPDGYLRALEILKIAPEKALIFEDSEPGVRSAIAAGCRVVLVRHCRSLSADSPWNSRVHAAIETLEHVNPEWIRRQWG